MNSTLTKVLQSFGLSFITSLTGTIFWVFLVVFVYPLLTGDSLTEIIDWSYARAINALYFGGFIALIFTVPYRIIYFIYLNIKERFSEIENSYLQRSLNSFVLSLPLVITVFISTVLPTGTLGPFWSEGFDMAILVSISTWTAIFITIFLVNNQWLYGGVSD